MSKRLTPTKARKILRHKKVKGKPLTSKAKRFMGLIAGGGKPTRIASRSHVAK